MKVIEQLIQFFFDRGSLSRKEIEHFTNRGFWSPPESYEDYEEPVEDFPADDDIWLEDAEHRLAKRRRGGKRGPAKSKILEEDELCAELAGRFPSWEEPLRGLVELAPVGHDWKQASIALRQVDDEALSQGIRRQLERGTLGLPSLWRALDFEGYREVPTIRPARGPAVNAYRVLLTATPHSELGRFAWILRQREMRAVYNLLRAQRRVLGAFGEFYKNEPALLNRAIQRSPMPSVFWAFVLLYNADRYEALGYDQENDYPSASWVRRHAQVYWTEHPSTGLPSEVEDYDPAKPVQFWTCSPETWQQAWSDALLMDAERVAPLFEKYYVDDVWNVYSRCGLRLFCPNRWRPF